MRKPSRFLVATAVVAALAAATPALAQEAPTSEGVFYALQDVSLVLDGIAIRTALGTETGASALLQLGDGTLVDVQLAAAQEGWAVRDISLVAGNADTFRGWSSPWRERVDAAQNFIAGTNNPEAESRSAEELAPLSWFEDPDESTRLWGMNPVTYRMMQTLQMMPTLTGPMGAGPPTNPVPRRNDQ